MKPFLWGLLNTLQWLLIVLWTVLWTSVALFIVLLTRRPGIGLAMARRIWAPGVAIVAGAQLSVVGAERIDPRRPWFFACNHQSFGDIPVLFWALPADLCFVAKRELRMVPFLGWYMQAMGMIFVDRRRRRSGVASLDAAADLLRSGRSVLSFPAGTRRSCDGPQGFKPAALAPAL
ncbi:MAG TPA: lysophospholipid acyltransferase family protein, partial [Thermoanaerobaculia bacterium]|nr:lysophospholipid acyltransferase family protein [Thermoanaerobaculia bacterium]